jgi:AcrR family transcriptional regulator
MNKLGSICSRGRPREFCVDGALAAALRVFWSKGYDGASLTDLTEAMGITRPSLYAAFGNKEALFCKALDLYEREKMAYIDRSLAEPTARRVADAMLRGAVENMSGCEEPQGCLQVIASVASGPDAQSIRDAVAERGKVFHDAIIERLERARAEGDLPPHIDPVGLADYMKAVFQGISLQASAGASREQLDRLVDTSLALWPSS